MQDVLDEQRSFYDFSFGNQAAWYVQLFGYVLVFSGLTSITSSWIIALVSLLIGLRMAATRSGIKLDANKGRYQVYLAYLYFIKIGKWQSLENYPHFSVLRTQAGETQTSLGGNQNTRLEYVWDVMLLTANHRSKLFVKRFKDEAAAWDLADVLARALKKECAVYSPQISAASRAKRERGRRR